MTDFVQAGDVCIACERAGVGSLSLTMHGAEAPRQTLVRWCR